MGNVSLILIFCLDNGAIIKNEIDECFSSTDYSSQAAKALMKSPNLLQDIYEEWLGREGPVFPGLFGALLLVGVIPVAVLLLIIDVILYKRRKMK